jgi:hypothetical protein
MEPGYITVTGERATVGGVAAKQLAQSLKIPSKILLEAFSPRDFGYQGDIPSLNFFKKTNYQHAVSLISAGAIEGNFARKTWR